MQKFVICFLLRGGKVCLSRHKRGPFVGKMAGYGGKIEDESPEACAIREIREECGVHMRVEDLRQKALIHVFYENGRRVELYVFVTRQWTGRPVESNEHGEPHWPYINALPFSAMKTADDRWVKRALSGKRFDADLYLNENGTIYTDIVFRDPSFLPREALCTICSRTKRADEDPLPARERYLGSHIRAVEEIARARGRQWFLVSGIFGLIAPDEQILSYDHRLAANKIRGLASKIRSQLRRFGIEELHLYSKSKPDWMPYRAAILQATQPLGVKLHIHELADDD